MAVKLNLQQKMPTKIGFTVIFNTGEDERYRATELNYHGPTVKGWRSAQNCPYPQEITMQLNTMAVLHRIQILAHQYLIPQKIEIWISEELEYDPSMSPSAVQSFEYLGFITLSDNQATGFKSRELKSVTVPPTTARYVKLRLHSNHINDKNIYNQVGLVAVNVLGEEIPELDAEGDELNNNGHYYSNQTSDSTMISNPQYVSPYDDLAFEMYVDKDVARIMRVMEAKKHQAVIEERFEYASKLKMALEDLREAGETLGKFEQEKRQAINMEDYDKAKAKKLQIDQYRDQVYTVLRVDQLLELDGPLEENDLNSGSPSNKTLRKQELAPPSLESFLHKPESDLDNFSPNFRPYQGPISPITDNLQPEDKFEWEIHHHHHQLPYCKSSKSEQTFNRPQTPNQMIHSQSHTSFSEQYNYNRSQSPPNQYYLSSSSNPQICQYVQPVYPDLSTPQAQFNYFQKFTPNTPLYGAHPWQQVLNICTPQPSSEMYHSMPTPQTQETGRNSALSNAPAEFPSTLPLRTPKKEADQFSNSFTFPQIVKSNTKSQTIANQKYVDFESPVAQNFETPRILAPSEVKTQVKETNDVTTRSKSPSIPNITNLSKSPPANTVSRPNSLRGSLRRRNKSAGATPAKSSFEAYEERMLPALRHFHGNDVVRECQLGLEQNSRKSKLNEREKKQAVLSISVFGIEMVERFYSKHFTDKEEGLRQLQEELKRQVDTNAETNEIPQHSPNKVARAAIFLLHRALRDKVYSVYSMAADTIRLFFSDFVSNSKVTSAEVARSVERLLPELIAKTGDATPRIHNMATHTLLSMADCKEVRNLHLIPVHLSRPLTSSVHPRLALSRLEMIEQLILNHGISTEKQSGLTCRTLAEFGSSGLHHPAEAVRKVSERILIQVYKVNPRLVRKQLPPDDDITRRNLLYRQLFQEFDFMDLQRKRELNDQGLPVPKANGTHENRKQEPESNGEERNGKETKFPSHLPKRTVNQQTSPTKPYLYCPSSFGKDENSHGILRKPNNKYNNKSPPKEKSEPFGTPQEPTKNGDIMEKRKSMSRISEERIDVEGENISSAINGNGNGNGTHITEDDPTLKFPNLVDSVRVAEDRLSFAQKGIRNLKSLKYIFPTSYIGNSTTSQETVNLSNSTSTFCKMTKKPEISLEKTSPTSYSGIPIPTNGHNGKTSGFLASIVAAKKLTKKSENKTEAVPTEDNVDEKNKEDKEDKEDNNDLMNASMTASLYIGNETTEETEEAPKQTKEETVTSESSSASVITSPSEDTTPAANEDKKAKEQDGQTYKMCIFCFASENWFTEESLNIHYWKNCPMLTRCVYCKEVVEIAGLIQHRLDDCDHNHLFQKCEKCLEAIFKDSFENHECTPSTSKTHRTRCPLCHTDIEKEENWRDHLMGSNVCPNHPRKKQNSGEPSK